MMLMGFAGTLEDPIIVNSAGEEQYVGCTGCPADSHNVIWITLSREEPVSRCMECGSAYKMHYVGPPDDPHSHDHGHHHGMSLIRIILLKINANECRREPIPPTKEHGRLHQARIRKPISLEKLVGIGHVSIPSRDIFSNLSVCSIVKNRNGAFSFNSRESCLSPVSCRVHLKCDIYNSLCINARYDLIPSVLSTLEVFRHVSRLTISDFS